MAKKSAPAPPQPAELTVEQIEQAIPRLKKRIDDLETLTPEKIDADNPSATTGPLEAAIADSLVRTFGADTVEYRRYESAARFYWPMYLGRRAPPHEIVAGIIRSKETGVALLKEAVRSLEERLEEKRSHGPSAPAVSAIEAEAH